MLGNSIKKFALNQAFSYMEKDPIKNLIHVMDMVDKFAGDGPESFPRQRAAVREAVSNENSTSHKLVVRMMTEMDLGFTKTLLSNFFLNASITGWKKGDEIRQKYDCNVPWAILLDPTSACNLHCKGCWAAEYGNKLNLSYEEIDGIIRQGKEMGTYFYIYTGGEPLVRKKDLLKLCEEHNDAIFMCFTNATLIDEEFAEGMAKVQNFVPVISVEGFEEATDFRRGDGTYGKVVKAMNLLKEHHLPFGISTCYTSANVKDVSSEAYIDQLVDWGAFFVWYFHYMPVGKDAVPELMPTPEQREYMYHQIRDMRGTKPIFMMDFQNDGEYVGGCIAGGRRYLHINANGDVDPCVFIHYSDSNIREKTLLEALCSPLFKAYHDGQPFNDNHLRPCPMLENPHALRDMVNRTQAKSTDLESPETVENLCSKCDAYAENWQPTAEKIWTCSHDCAGCGDLKQAAGK
ncbi:MAG: radical SAM protein [Ruminiclostridium sp.]|jgi:MoaA/NifB/PqqE/SkfB family radical SAM enzyme|nr:radical SAM protein [Ruminiclostridium sp.]